MNQSLMIHLVFCLFSFASTLIFFLMWLLAAAAAAAAAAAGESDAEQLWFHLWLVSAALPLTITLEKKNVGVGLVDAIVGSRCSCL